MTSGEFLAMVMVPFIPYCMHTMYALEKKLARLKEAARVQEERADALEKEWNSLFEDIDFRG